MSIGRLQYTFYALQYAYLRTSQANDRVYVLPLGQVAPLMGKTYTSATIIAALCIVGSALFII